MRKLSHFVWIAASGLSATAACRAQPFQPRILLDASNDAVTRRTDDGNNGPISQWTGRPDLVNMTIGGWMPSDPARDHYTGSYVDPASADIFRLDLTFRGRVNPPGRILGGTFSPFQFGITPLYGFIEFDVDNDSDTGGELGGAATHRYLANAARFGGRAHGPVASRTAVRGCDHDFEYDQGPQFERSGADFALTLCGCYNVTLLSYSPEGGETWVVRGRFFQRSGGYQCASSMFGGSDFGLYDPQVKLRFHYDELELTTTVTLVYALTMHGAAILATLPTQEPPPDQPVDPFIDIGGSHSAVVEGLHDVILGAHNLQGACYDLANRWEGRNAADYLDPTRWAVTALVGTTYELPQEAAYYVWTDVGFDHILGDVDADGRAGAQDRIQVQLAIETLDGTTMGCDIDCDGIVNGQVEICNFSANFNLYDIDGDGYIGPADLAIFQQICSANWDGVIGVDSADFFAFIIDFLAGQADFNHDGMTSSVDFFAFLTAFFGGC